jgi:DNA-binding FadR family transcriptional regulator
MEQQVQCQILLNLRFKTMSDYAPGTAISDHTKILQAMERGDTQTAQSLTEEIGERVSQECIKTLQMLEN